MDENQVNDTNFYAVVGSKIRLARKEKGIDQETFAKCVQLTRTSIINIEKGRQRPSVYQMWLMAQHLNLTITELIPPLDIGIRMDDWTEKVENNEVVEDDDQKKVLMSFITATRITK